MRDRQEGEANPSGQTYVGLQIRGESVSSVQWEQRAARPGFESAFYVLAEKLQQVTGPLGTLALTEWGAPARQAFVAPTD